MEDYRDRNPTLALNPTASGLLADAVGLGKTLTMLSAIVYSLDTAYRFSLAPNARPSHDHATPIRATLVIVPSARRSLLHVSRSFVSIS